MPTKRAKFKPVTLKHLQELGRHIDTDFVFAKKMTGKGGLYDKLNAKYPYEEWTLLCSPVWIGNLVVAFVCRPRVE